MSFCLRAEELMRLEHNAKLHTLSPEAWIEWKEMEFYPRRLRIIEALNFQRNLGFNRQEPETGPPPFLIDLGAIVDGKIVLPTGLNPNNEASRLVHSLGLRGLWNGQDAENISDPIEWAIYEAENQARRGTFWDMFISLKDI